jgi:hypothetical protein
VRFSVDPTPVTATGVAVTQRSLNDVAILRPRDFGRLALVL